MLQPALEVRSNTAVIPDIWPLLYIVLLGTTTGRKCYADGQYLSRRPFIGAVGIGPGLGRGRNLAVGLGMPSA
jgi:hypothetical protein